MKETRIYGKNIEINCSNTKDFYDQRAKKIDEMECPYTAVLLGDQDASYAAKWNEFECEFILPKLALDNNNVVIDIGCGMGRWAEVVIPQVKEYWGTDFSSGMVSVAKKRCERLEGNGHFVNQSFQEFVDSQKEETALYDRVIVGGVCMYINDKDLKACYEGLLNTLKQDCKIYFTETVATQTRLTLDECPSEALKTNYDVIYRTTEEYNEYYKIFLENGFKIIEQGYLPHLNKEKAFYETDRWYTILVREG